MRIKSILISIVIAATAGMWCACNDDLDLGVNDAKLEKVEGFRISKFTTDRLNWAIDNGADIRIVFHSNADDALYEFSMTVDNSGSKPVYAIHIPEKQTIPDGEYDALAFLGNGKAICPRMKFKIIKEIVEEIQAREGKFRLPGHGTQEKPYIIGSKEAFNEFEIGLCEDGNSKGFGLFFEQTASFDVPPRSQIITGTYHACESFAGNYQGNGFTLTVPYTGSTSEPNDCEIGLFKELVGGAVIHNLTINAMIQGVHSNGGALAGKSSGKVMIDSVNIEGSINAQNRYNIGGIIGYATGELTISNSSIMAFVAGEDAIGGAVGLFKDGSLTISKFYNAKVDKNKRGDESRSYMPFSVTASANNAGGLVGRVDGSTTNISISDVTMVRSVQAEDGNLKAVSVVGENAGGLIGGLFNFKSCQFRNVSLNFPVYGGDSTGGLAGYTSMGGDMSIENCRFFSVASGNNSVGGLFGTVRGHSHSIAVEGSDDGTSVKQDANSLVKISGKLNVGGFAGTSGITKNVGGIVGYIKNSFVTNLCFAGTVEGCNNVGGIIGLADNIDKGYVRGCVNNSPKIDNKISDSTGGIIGRLNQEGKAKNFYLKNAVNVGKVTGTGQVGGCVGHYWASGILNLGIETIHYILYCANYGEVNGSNGGNVGGIIGYFNARKAVVSHSANHGKVYGSGNDVKVGGIAGRMGSNDEAGTALPNNMELSYSCNFGEVGSNTGNANVGGLLGWQEQGSPDDETHYMLHNCYNMGIVPTNQDSDNGGVLGCIDHLGEVQNCYNAKKVSHGNGIIGTHKGGSIFYHHNLYVLEDSGKYWCADKFKESDKSKESTYKGFDFKSIWAVSTSTNNGFPYLRDCPYQFKKLE